MKPTAKRFRAIVIGASAGGLEALKTLLPALRENLPVPVLIVQHIAPNSDSYLPTYLDERAPLHVKEAEDKEILLPGVVYVAPPNYHLLVEADNTMSLCAGHRVNYSRPSIDVLFESAADAFGPRLIGVILTGANQDGAQGLARIKKLGGVAIVQSPRTAVARAMPVAALEATQVDHVLPLEDIAPLLNTLINANHE